jgi:hypothetical protein
MIWVGDIQQQHIKKHTMKRNSTFIVNRDNPIYVNEDWKIEK